MSENKNKPQFTMEFFISRVKLYLTIIAVLVALFFVSIYAILLFDRPPTEEELAEMDRERQEELEERMEEQKEDDEFAVRICAQTDIESRLVAPSTAEFSSYTPTVFFENRTYGITGYVDSENVFGVSLRNQFACEVKVINNQTFDCKVECTVDD